MATDAVRRGCSAIAIGVATLIAVFAATAVWAGAPVLASHAALAAVSVLSLAVAFVTQPKTRICAAGTAGLAATALLAWTWPRPVAPADFPSVDRYIRGYAPANLWFAGIPEHEFIRVGSSLLTTPTEHSRDLARGQLLRSYAPIGPEPPHAASRTLDSLLFDRGHFWFAYPKTATPAPLLVFLHGHGGNFRFYPNTLAKPLNAHGIAVAFPTYGVGDWRGPAARARVRTVIAECRRLARIDRRQVFLAGLSAGGMATIRWLDGHELHLAGSIAISGVPLDDADLPAAVQERRLLILHGSADERVPLTRATDVAQKLKARGATVELQTLEATHFMLLAESDAVTRRILAWIRAQTD